MGSLSYTDGKIRTYLAWSKNEKSTRNNKNTNTAELIPYDILEMIENFALYSNHKEKVKCFCSI
jgi:hypothetical protein